MIRRPPRSTLFPYTRSSDLFNPRCETIVHDVIKILLQKVCYNQTQVSWEELSLFGTRIFVDRKSTRLNSSHANISYAVFCLKKKTKRYIVKVYKQNIHNTLT